jgi:hypothetical protein
VVERQSQSFSAILLRQGCTCDRRAGGKYVNGLELPRESKSNGRAATIERRKKYPAMKIARGVGGGGAAAEGRVTRFPLTS